MRPRVKSALFFLVAISLTGCAIAPLQPPEITSDWKVQQGQAVWTPPKAKNGIAGELLVATNSSGDFIVEFSKPPITIANAQRVGKNWQVEFPGEQKSYRGRGAGPSRVIWLHLPPALAGSPGEWNFAVNANGWKLEKDGEALEGFLAP
jgi:hypothetical protein